MSVGCLVLQEYFLMLLRSLIVYNIIIECYWLVLINTSNIPFVSSTSTHLIVWNVYVLRYSNGGYLTNSSLNLDLFWAQMHYLSQESHLKFSIFINFEELLETLLKHWVTERISHDIETTSTLETSLHFKDTDLIQSCHKQIDNDTLNLGSSW